VPSVTSAAIESSPAKASAGRGNGSWGGTPEP
jgi:hypothetical protein